MEGNWRDSQLRHCAKAMQASISATHLRMDRPGFGQQVTPRRGSVLASPVMAAWDPEPDYFFHWLRDSALVMDAVNFLSRDAQSREERQHWNLHFQNFIRFSLQISHLDGAGSFDAGYQDKARPGLRQYLRPADELRTLRGDDVLKEPRVNADGTLDTHQWSRPQYDGPALRALTCLRHWDLALAQKRKPGRLLAALLDQDLDFTLRHAAEPCIGPWEEENDQHYYTLAVQAGALHHGSIRAELRGDAPGAKACRVAAARVLTALDGHWDEKHGLYKASRGKAAEHPEDHLDIAVILGVLHARLPAGRHSVSDPRVQATYRQLQTMFDRDYPINQTRPAGTGPAFGRYRTDRYFSGGAYYFSTLAAAEFNYRRAGDTASVDKLREGDAIMAMVRQTIPPDGSLSEQFDKASGQQTSARHLAWSYAAFITACEARKAASIALNRGSVSHPALKQR